MSLEGIEYPYSNQYADPSPQDVRPTVMAPEMPLRYLTKKGSDCLFGTKRNLQFLPVRTAQRPWMRSLYDVLFEAESGSNIGGYVSADAVSAEIPSDAEIQRARNAFRDHRANFDAEVAEIRARLG